MNFEQLTDLPAKVKGALALGLSTIALGGAIEAAPAAANTLGGPPVPGQEYVPPYSQDPLTAQCEVQALHSFEAGHLSYIRRNGKSNKFVRSFVSGKALSDSCESVVDREFSTEETINFGSKFYLNTPQTIVDRSSDAFNTSVVQRTRVPYHCGKSIQQIVHVEVTPTNGDPTMINNFISEPVRAC